MICLVGLVISEWAKLNTEIEDCPLQLKQRLHQSQEEVIYFDEIAHSFTKLAQETRDFLATLRHYKVPVEVASDQPLTLPLIEQVTGNETERILVNFKLKAKILESLQERRRSIQTNVLTTASEQRTFTICAKGKYCVLFKFKLICTHLKRNKNVSSAILEAHIISPVGYCATNAKTSRICVFKKNTAVSSNHLHLVWYLFI